MAGGFFLIRTHPADIAPARLLRFLDAPNGATPGYANELDRLVEQCRPCLCTTGDEDVVAMVRAWEEAGQLTASDGPLPMLSDVGFDDAASLAARMATYSASPSLRESVVAVQRKSVSARLGYDAGIRRVVMRMRDLLRDTAMPNEQRRAA